MGGKKGNNIKYIFDGLTQLEMYKSGVWKAFPDTELKEGYNIESGYFYYESGNKMYRVDFWYWADGLILYDYYRIDNNSSGGGSSMAVFLALGGCAVIYSMLSKMSSKPLQTKSA